MNILICNYEYPPIGGGGGVTARGLAEELAKKHSVTVLTSAFGAGIEKDNHNGVEIYRVPVLRPKNKQTASLLSMLLYWPGGYILGSRLCRKHKFDVLNSHFAIPTGPASIMLAKRFKIPHILSIHGGDIFDPSKKLSPHRTWGLHFVVQSVMNLSEKVLAQSTDTRDNVYKNYKVNKPIEIIPHGIKRPSFTRRDRRFFGFKDGDILLITLGRLIPRKGIPGLVELVSRLPDKNIKLLVLGDGPDRAFLEELVARRNLRSRVSFLGRVSEEEKFQLLDIADLYVSATLHEGFGLIFIEAMSCGLPIVSYDKGGHRDFLEDGKTGFLAPLGNLELFRERVNQLIYKKDLRNEIGRRNTKTAERYYIENCASQYEKVFLDAVSGEKGYKH